MLAAKRLLARAWHVRVLEPERFDDLRLDLLGNRTLAYTLGQQPQHNVIRIRVGKLRPRRKLRRPGQSRVKQIPRRDVIIASPEIIDRRFIDVFRQP